MDFEGFANIILRAVGLDEKKDKRIQRLHQRFWPKHEVRVEIST